MKDIILIITIIKITQHPRPIKREVSLVIIVVLFVLFVP